MEGENEVEEIPEPGEQGEIVEDPAAADGEGDGSGDTNGEHVSADLTDQGDVDDLRREAGEEYQGKIFIYTIKILNPFWKS